MARCAVAGSWPSPFGAAPEPCTVTHWTQRSPSALTSKAAERRDQLGDAPGLLHHIHPLCFSKRSMAPGFGPARKGHTNGASGNYL